MNKITGIIITLNEEKNIKDCILSLKKLCHEIIVVDSLSKDNTVEIAKDLGAVVYLQKYLGDGPQKAFGVKYAKNDWILSIDADERLEDDLIEKVSSLELKNEDIAYAFRRRNFVGNHWIKAAGFYPDYVTRLYNRKTSGYLDKKAHSKVEAPKIKKIKGHITHYTYESYSHWVERLSWFCTNDAWGYYQDGRKVGKYKPVLSAIGAFFQKFIVKGGIFQGVDGFTVTLTTMFRAYMKYTILNEIHENSKNEKKEC
ncbi:MAG: glycosyltransferase family 2 protein [Desulforegulaceae bacterium]|nr:glycosyltransferase family 2 protein [Desulforegulaceae bacterium]